MYNELLENEISFVSTLFKSHNIEMANGETVTVCMCPKCHKGNVVTICTHSKIKSMKTYSFKHYCDNCNEVFRISRINADIFFNTPYVMTDRIETPFGNISVQINDKPVDFRLRREIYEDDEYTSDKPVSMFVIDVDMSNLKVGDTVFCGFENTNLLYDSADERSVVYYYEDDINYLALCAFEPDDLSAYCYQLVNYPEKGFVYEIINDPIKYDCTEFYKSTIASLAVVCLSKNEYKNYETAAFLALTDLIF